MRMFSAGTAAISVVLSTAMPIWADGKLTVATIGEPPTLDLMQSQVVLVNTITQHIYETLFTFDGKWQPKPLLAATMPDISEDGLVYRIALRDGVRFHDGEPLTADDVVASLDRFLDMSSKGKPLAPYVDSITATGPLEVTIALKKRYAPLLEVLSQYSVILPKSKLGGETLTEFVGTGPYMLKERKPDQYIQLVKFPDYVSPEGPANFMAGHREADADEIIFMPVPDANTRVEGILGGQYDYADSLPISAYDRLKSSDAAVPVIAPNSGWMGLHMNTSQGLMTDVHLRKAATYALNAADLMAAAFDNPDFFTTNAALFPEDFAWYTDAGIDRPEEGDIEKAQTLLKEAGYDGTPVRVLATRQYEYHFKLAQVAKAYLEAAGFKVDLIISDWATLTSRRADPAQWDIFVTHSTFPADPSMHNLFSAGYPGWYDTPGKQEAMSAYLETVTPADREAAWQELQTQFYVDAPIYKAGDFNALSGAGKGIEGIVPAIWPFFWNVKPAK